MIIPSWLRHTQLYFSTQTFLLKRLQFPELLVSRIQGKGSFFRDAFSIKVDHQHFFVDIFFIRAALIELIHGNKIIGKEI